MIKTILLYTGYVLATAVVTGVSYLNLAPQFGSNPSSLEKKQYAELSNYKDGSFINNEKTPLMTGDVSTWDFFKNDSMRKPKNLTPRKINYSKFVDESNSDYRLAWLGHSAFIINISGIIILLDPMLGSHASPIPLPSLKRYNDELPIDLSSIPNIDFVILSHDHYDHLDYSTIKRIKEKVNTFLVPLGVGNHLRNWDVKDEKIIELNWDQSFQKDAIEFICLPARHFSGRGPLNRNSSLWSSWAIKSSIVKIYFSGDSGYGSHLKKIGNDHGPFDISLIDCGQYNKAWKYSHMFPSEVVLASIELKSKYFIPIHWGAFTLSMHPWDEPVKESKRIADERGLNCLTPEIGEILSRKKLNKEFPSWWDQY